MSKVKDIDWTDLSILYLNQKLSTIDIAKLKGVTPRNVSYALEKRDITRRQGAEAQLKYPRYRRYHERWEDLEDLYVNKNLSLYRIAKLKQVTPQSVRHQLKKLNIHIRNYGEASRLRANLSGRIKGRTLFRGYTMVWNPTHLRAGTNGYVREHILVWEQIHNKPLPKGWVIHHLNGIKSDNRPENLIALPDKKHIRILSAKAQRIRELEAKVKLLERALDGQQMIWWSDN